MPEPAEIADGCRSFVSNYFSFGFTKEVHLLERLENPYNGIGSFLLTCMLAMSSPFTESLVRRYDGALRASEILATKARSMALSEQYKPNLENTQAFFLLGIYEWAHGRGQLGWMQMGVAVRMAGLLKLHRESTYDLPHNATSEECIASESARRTFWLIQSHDQHLASGTGRPKSFDLLDIDVQLPSSEEDFCFGQAPVQRAVLANTSAAKGNEHLEMTPYRSLYATVIQGPCVLLHSIKHAIL